MKKNILALVSCVFSFALFAQSNLPAFPGAEGGGKYVTGGRGGTVYYVNTLEDNSNGNSTTKEGSLRWCLNQSGTRTILFKVSGIIELNSRLTISKGNVTIAGQSAPGDGICIKDNSVCITADNVIIRYLRFRPGDANPNFEDDAIWGRWQKNIILDHCSMSFSVDECASFYGNQNFTMQWCFLAESLNTSQHAKGAHGYGGLWGGQNASFHHNILAHHNSRNPRLNGWKRSGLSYKCGNTTEETVDFRNNVVYNWGGNSCYGGEAAGQYNMINNYYKSGPASSNKYRLVQIDKDAQSYPVVVNGKSTNLNHGVYYLSGNYMYGNEKVTKDNWSTEGITNKTGLNISECKMNQALNFDIPTHTAEVAYEKVLAYCGASLARDAQDARVVGEIKAGNATYKGSKSQKYGMIDTPGDVGGYCTYNSLEAPADTDRDGMPDAWETAHGLDPNNAADRNTKDEEGYTMLEVYLNDLVADITRAQYEDVLAELETPVAGSLMPIVSYKDGRLSYRCSKAVDRLEVYTLEGRMLQQIETNLRNESSLSLSLPDGIYLLLFACEDGSRIQTRLMAR